MHKKCWFITERGNEAGVFVVPKLHVLFPISRYVLNTLTMRSPEQNQGLSPATLRVNITAEWQETLECHVFAQE